MITNQPTSFEGYSQGGAIIDSVAYFTANAYRSFPEPGRVNIVYREGEYPYIAAFSADSLHPIRTYDFEDTYDSAPLVIRHNGRLMLVAHQYKLGNTRARDAETGKLLWESAPNQTCTMFFGFSYYHDAGRLIILVCSDVGLHAIDADNGAELWYFSSGHGVTPCVDQNAGVVYFQYESGMAKLDASTGRLICRAGAGHPGECISWNTVLARAGDDTRIATYWYSKGYFGSALRVYDQNLNLVWEKVGVPGSRKVALCCADGRLYMGSGDHWNPEAYVNLEDKSWKKLTAYDIDTGAVVWAADLSQYTYCSLRCAVYCNGFLIAETQTSIHDYPYLIFVFNASTGEMLRVYNREGPANSCAPPVFSAGAWYSGDLISNSILVTRLGEGEPTDWTGAFGNGQTHCMTAPDNALTSLY